MLVSEVTTRLFGSLIFGGHIQSTIPTRILVRHSNNLKHSHIMRSLTICGELPARLVRNAKLETMSLKGTSMALSTLRSQSYHSLIIPTFANISQSCCQADIHHLLLHERRLQSQKTGPSRILGPGNPEHALQLHARRPTLPG